MSHSEITPMLVCVFCGQPMPDDPSAAKSKCDPETISEMHKNNAIYYKMISENYDWHIKTLEERLSEKDAVIRKLSQEVLNK